MSQNVKVGGQQGNAKHDDDYCAYDVGEKAAGFGFDAVHFWLSFVGAFAPFGLYFEFVCFEESHFVRASHADSHHV